MAYQDEWIINGKVYDLSQFLESHPGGKHILLINRGRDCTELFFSYHLPSHKGIQSFLDKYYIRDASSNQIKSPFNWNGKNYELYLDLKSRIQSHFDSMNRKAYKAPFSRQIWYLFLLIFMIISYTYWFDGYWSTIPILGILHWVLSSDILHSGTHYSLSIHPKINFILSVFGGFFHAPNIIWEMQHVISHHSYTNISTLDVDLNHFLDNFRTSKQQKYENIYKKWRYFIPIYMLATSIGQIDAWTVRIERKIHHLIPIWMDSNITPPYVLYLYFLQVIWIFVILPILVFYRFDYEFWKALGFIILPRVVHGVLFYVFSQVSHIQTDAFTEQPTDKTDKTDKPEKTDGNNELDLQSDSWIIHQIRTCVDYSTDSLFWNVASIGLNSQTIHHLFPSIHPSYCIELEPVLHKFCEDNKIKRNVYPNIFVALLQHFKYLATINDYHTL